MQYAQVASNLADHEKKAEAKNLLERCDKMMLQENFPYGLVSRHEQQDQISGQFLLAAYKCGDTVLAKKVSESLRKDLEQLSKDIASKQQRLEDQTFRSRAPEHIVKGLETTLAERRMEYEKLKERLKQLEGNLGTSA